MAESSCSYETLLLEEKEPTRNPEYLRRSALKAMAAKPVYSEAKRTTL